ncbi:bacteriorhodopsin [Natrarchaeobaculum aegyptiacum]|uniref:Rhodopsin n=1 Tax=Natrarchaeobaculum aegyptiacum TaxID=745377 RepID=A0A2Z2HQQ8_9EURY|nr:bacteriorhodopsin [Natrarchaeobaculum aegyptiacum]ARS89379.1 hypothetical protein B1756_06200 [Natrarchaeobaculum aegyptiacum]
MIDVSTIYFVSSLALGVAAVAFAAMASRLPAVHRRYGLVTVVATGSMALAYLAMAGDVLAVETTGRDQSLARFLGYTVAFGGICYLIGVVSGCGRRRTLLLFGFTAVNLWVSLASWLLEGILETVATAVIFGGLLGVVYLLFGPIQRAAAARHGDRALLYGKLKYLLVLGWAILVTLSVASEQNLALLDTFAGQLVASYADVIIFLGFGGFVLRNATAFDAVTAESSPSSDDHAAVTRRPTQ